MEKFTKVVSTLLAALMLVMVIPIGSFAENNKLSTADELAVSSTVYDNLSSYGDVNYYKITTTSAGVITVKFTHEHLTSSNEYWRVLMIDADGTTMYNHGVSGKGTSATLPAVGVPVGVYYIKIEAHSSRNHSRTTYGLYAGFEQSDNWETEWNDSFLTADELFVYSPKNGSVMSSSDEDYYYFQVNSANTFTFSFTHEPIDSTSNYWTLKLYDENGKSLISKDVSGLNSSISFDCELSAGKYYVYVSDARYHSEATYTLTYSLPLDHSHAFGSYSKANDTTHKHICAICGFTEYSNHSWNSGAVTTQPTHTTTGVKTYTCADCGATKTEQIAKIDAHTYGEWTKHSETQHKGTCSCGEVRYADHSWNSGAVTTQPTHTTTGVKTYTCADCGATKTEQIAKIAEHSYGEWTKHSETQHKSTCSCGEVRYADHNWDAGVITTPATETSDGIRTYTCRVCGETKTETEVYVAFVYGDVNGDRSIDARDIVCLKKYLANLDHETGESTQPISAGADVNGDGKIDARDLVLLKKYIANYDFDTGSSSIVLGKK